MYSIYLYLSNVTSVIIGGEWWRWVAVGLEGGGGGCMDSPGGGGGGGYSRYKYEAPFQHGPMNDLIFSLV